MLDVIHSRYFLFHMFDFRCYCDVRINKQGNPGDLLFKLHYPTINAQNCQTAIQQCSLSCRTQAQRQLSGVVDFEQGGLENVAPEKDVSVGTMLCKECVILLGKNLICIHENKSITDTVRS